MESSNFTLFFAVILASFALSAALVPLVRFVARRADVLDKPEAEARKVHASAVPLLGGWAVFVSSTVVISAVRFFDLADFSAISSSLFLSIILASVVIIIGGTLDDKFSLKPYQQIMFPLAAVAIVLAAGLDISFITNPLGAAGEVIFISSGVGIAVAAFWLLGMMYTTKFLDGLDGLVGGVAVIASFFIFLASLRWDIPLSATGIWALILLGSCLGFLMFNWQPARIFLGEGGSIFIGFILGILSIITGSKIITTLLVMGIPALDVLWVIIRRLTSGRSPFSGDRNHMHYRLMQFGLSKKQSVIFLYVIAMAFGSLAFISSSYGKLILVICLVALMAMLSYAISLKIKKAGN